MDENKTSRRNFIKLAALSGSDFVLIVQMPKWFPAAAGVLMSRRSKQSGI